MNSHTMQALSISLLGSQQLMSPSRAQSIYSRSPLHVPPSTHGNPSLVRAQSTPRFDFGRLTLQCINSLEFNLSDASSLTYPPFPHCCSTRLSDCRLHLFRETARFQLPSFQTYLSQNLLLKISLLQPEKTLGLLESGPPPALVQ